MTAPTPKEDVSAGLKKVLSDVPTRAGYLELGAALSRSRGPEAWLEAGFKPKDGLALFARGSADREDAGVMVGARWEF